MNDDLRKMKRSIRNDGEWFPIVEMFPSIQFEGSRSGTFNYFIRLAGCNLDCPFCDTDISFFCMMKASDIVATIKAEEPDVKNIVITGGEPLIHDLDILLRVLKDAGYFVSVESNGILLDTWGERNRQLFKMIDWLTVSPKTKISAPTLYRYASELKYVIPDFEKLLIWTRKIPVFLQPEWNNPASLNHCMDLLRRNPRFRLSVQTHKFMGLR